MPRSSTGKWVARAASTGGGRTYRGQVPINWYAVLVLIVLLGVASVVVSRIDYRSGPVVNTTPPLKGATPWYAAISFDICGTQRAPLPANLLNATTQSFYTTGNGIITISPKQTSDAGHNAVLGKFVSSYPGLTLTATQLHLPAPTTTTAPGSTTSTTAPGSTTSTSSTSTSSTSTTTSTSSTSGKKVKSASGRTYRSGEKCPSGTKDAGKTADVMVTYWKNAFAAKGKPVTVQGNPGTLLFSDDQLITVGFVPAGTRLPKPNSTIVTALFDIASGRSTTTTTAPGSTTTTAPGSTTTTTAPGSTTTTTAPGSTTTTTAPGSTTTTAPGSTTTSTTTKAG